MQNFFIGDHQVIWDLICSHLQVCMNDVRKGNSYTKISLDETRTGLCHGILTAIVSV